MEKREDTQFSPLKKKNRCAHKINHGDSTLYSKYLKYENIV